MLCVCVCENGRVTVGSAYLLSSSFEFKLNLFIAYVEIYTNHQIYTSCTTQNISYVGISCK